MSHWNKVFTDTPYRNKKSRNHFDDYDEEVIEKSKSKRKLRRNKPAREFDELNYE